MTSAAALLCSSTALSVGEEDRIWPMSSVLEPKRFGSEALKFVVFYFFIHLKLRWKPLCLLQLSWFSIHYRVAYAADPDSDGSSHRVLYTAAVM